MRALLEVNVLIALFDPDHVYHDKAHIWWQTGQTDGWASCALTENGLIRIVSNPRYSAVFQFRPAEIIAKLSELAASTDHRFWNDDISLRDDTVFDAGRIHGPSQLTDLYLLALASHHGGRLVTFDRDIPLSAVRVASLENLCVL